MAFTVRDGALPPLLERILEMYLGWTFGSYVPWQYLRPLSSTVIGGMNRTRVNDQQLGSGVAGGISLDLLRQVAMASAAAAVAGCRAPVDAMSNIVAAVDNGLPTSCASMFGVAAGSSSAAISANTTAFTPPSDPITTFGIASIAQLMFCCDRDVLQRLQQATDLVRAQCPLTWLHPNPDRRAHV